MTEQHCQILNPLQRDGTSQNQRLVKALLPGSVPIDERSLADMLVYVHKYSALLRFYTTGNVPAGDWVDYIQHDVSASIALLTASDHQVQKKLFEKARKEVEVSSDVIAFIDLLKISYELARRLNNWYGVSREGLALHSSLKQLINSALKDSLQDLVSWSLDAVAAGVPLTLPEFTAFSDIWGDLKALPPKGVLSSPPTPNELDIAVTSITNHFELLYKAVAFSVEQAELYLEESLENYPDHQPHMALLLAFLQLFRYAQEHLNSLSEKHLQFYYEEVLQLQRKPEQADQVHLVFELAKQVDRHRLVRDQFFKAGKDAGGANLFYANDDELVINQARLSPEHGLKSVFLKKTDKVEGIYAAPYANSSDGLGQPIEDEEGKWHTFGNETMGEARIGFAVASPMLLLAEGERKIRVRFTLQSLRPLLKLNSSFEEVEKEFKNSLDLFLSGEKGWLPVSLQDVIISDKKTVKPGKVLVPDSKRPEKVLPDKRPPRLPTIIGLPKRLQGDSHLHKEDDVLSPLKVVDSIEAQEPYLEFHVVLQPEDPPVVAYDDQVLLDGFATSQPVMKFLLTHGGGTTSYLYEYLSRIVIQSLELSVEVSGAKDLILENDLGTLNAAKPFHPFGPVPKGGSKLYIGSNEVFQKSLQSVTLDVTWGDLPTEGFKDHYDKYKNKNGTIVDNNQHFEASLKQLHNGIWKEDVKVDPEGNKVSLAKSLFQPQDGAVDEARHFTYSRQLQRPDTVANFDSYTVGLQYGFLRLELQTSFLHNLYPKILADAVSTREPNAPNLPYTPLITELKLGYSARETVHFNKKTPKELMGGAERLFHLGPFGQVQVIPASKSVKVKNAIIAHHLVPDFPVPAKNDPAAEGTLYIGIEKLNPPENLSVLFQVAESSGDPTVENIPEVLWSYMVNNRWIAFKKTEILIDKTNGLLTSGIISFAIPGEITADNSLMPSGLHWIKASVEKESIGVARLIGVIPQAVVASFRNQTNDLSHLDSALPGATISKLKKRDGSIKKISQPFASFGGKLPERDEPFYTRVSERLRHKGRAITIFDYERLVLEQFPEIYKVKCINHARRGDEFCPGSVQLVVVPDLRNKNGVDPFHPSASVNSLKEIETFVSRLASDFVSVEITNPQYEEIQVACKVAFHKGYDQGFYLNELELQIIKFLSPWLYDDVADLSFGGRIHRSWILQHIEQQEYVDFVTDFRMNHYAQAGTNRLDVEEAIVQSSGSVLVSAEKHGLDIADSLVCEEKTSS